MALKTKTRGCCAWLFHHEKDWVRRYALGPPFILLMTLMWCGAFFEEVSKGAWYSITDFWEDVLVPNTSALKVYWSSTFMLLWLGEKKYNARREIK